MKKLFIALLFPISALAQGQGTIVDSTGNIISTYFSVGTKFTTAPLTVSNFATAFASPPTGTLGHFVSEGVNNMSITYDFYNTDNTYGPVTRYRRFGGTAASPAFVPSGTTLGGITAFGYGTSAINSVADGAAVFRSEADFTDASHPNYFSIYTTGVGSVTQAERMRIASTGALRLNAYGTGAITGTATYAAQFDASGNLIEGALGGGGVTQGALDDTAADIRAAIPVVSGTNTGDNAVNTLYSGLISNATHTGDATGATALTVVKIQGKDFPTLSGADDQKYPKYVSASNAFVMTAIAGGGNAQTADPLSQFASTTSAQFAGVISDETGTGLVVLGTSPAFLGQVTLPASTTTTSPVNVPSGTVETASEAGDILEYDGNAFYGSSEAGNRGVMPLVVTFLT